MERSLLQIYRDWMKACRHMGRESTKTEAIRSLVRREWKKHQFETDAEKIEEFREGQIRGLGNYLIYTVKSELIDKKPEDITK
ncbi:unnamed protein product [Blepharisma stoltei]|uniref:Complex 1 LYR protein domain-containing protein n=1 Tax=Blepharisma stoltei TaxID=1481888 RepID=A0AAU9IPH0_9CILI|nr:unnamed protein product [Blepharisma stoltei]